MSAIRPLASAVLALLLALAPRVLAQSDACDNLACAAPPPSPDAALEVFTPVPDSAIEPVRQAPRLDTLDGKTVALVGGSFMADVTHPELKRLILAEYPSAKVLLLSEIGSAGPWPRPGVVRAKAVEFQDALRDRHVDAVISGNGGCGLCTPKETGSCIAAELLGIPSVMIAAPGFSDQARFTARSAGIAILRVAVYPGAFASHTRPELLANTRDVLWPQIKRALFDPLDDAEAPPLPADRETFASAQDMQAAFLESGWTDGLPVLPPTPAAVDEFLAFTDLPPDASLGALPPAMRDVTVRHVAVNGVMAGCPPEFMPLLLAYVRAMHDGDFRRPLSSTHAWTPYAWVNGPVARQLGFDAGQGGLNTPKNAQLGRFISLALLNLAGLRVQENRMGTFGYMLPWCLAEDEAAALRLGWLPYHVQRGYPLDASAITAASAINWGNNLSPASSDPQRVKDMIAWDAAEKSQMALASGMPCVHRVFLLTESVARVLAAEWPTKDALEDVLVQTSRIPLGQRAFANYWGNPGSAANPERLSLRQHERRLATAEDARLTDLPPWYEWTGLPAAETIPAMELGKSAFLVTGDPSRNKELCLPGGAFATVPIELPADWDRLMADRGYPPLSSFFLPPPAEIVPAPAHRPRPDRPARPLRPSRPSRPQHPQRPF